MKDIFPGLTDVEIGEKVATYFNRISQEYEPLGDFHITARRREVEKLELWKVSAILKSFKKPKSQVKGDILPRLVTAYSDILGHPFNPYLQ